MAPVRTDVLIVGGGLAGLALAHELEVRGVAWRMVEGRDRLGGRILAANFLDSAFDLGPSWFWPGQPRMDRLTRSLGLEVFEQYSEGETIFEDQAGGLRRFSFSSMQGSRRIAGGVSAVIGGLAQQLPQSRLQLGIEVRRLHFDGRITAFDATDEPIGTAERVVLAIPPRIASRLTFSPKLPEQASAALASVPTWMAGQAKLVAVYAEPFWRADRLSGDAVSRRGPLVEIHDASSVRGPGALFGFVGVAPAVRRGHRAELLERSLQQLKRLFGEAAREPSAAIVHDWAGEPLTSTDADRAPLSAHPRYGLPAVLQGLWERRLFFGSTEVAPEFGGFLEGALAAAESVARCLDGNSRG